MFQTEERWSPFNSHIDIAIAHSTDGNYAQTGFEVTDRVTMMAGDASNFRQPRCFSAHVVPLGLERCLNGTWHG